MMSTTARAETLGSIPLFRKVPPAAIARLDRQCAWKRASAGEWLLDYQDASDGVYFVVAGAVRVIIQSGGREVLLREIKAGEFFGELAAIDHQPRSSGIMAVLDVTIGRMPASVFRSAVHEFATLDVPHRIAAELLRLSRPDPKEPGRAIVSPPPIHAEIAARVSTRREAVARQLNTLERAGLIERRRGAIVLTDVDSLRRQVDEAADTG